MIEINRELADQLVQACGQIRESEDCDLYDVLETLGEQVAKAVAAADQAEAAERAEQSMAAATARRFARSAKAEMDAQAKLMGERLLDGLGMTDSQASSLLRAQAEWMFYALIAGQDDEAGVLELLASGVGEARRVLQGGRESTSSVDRAFMEYERKAAARFLAQWAALV